MDPIGKRLVKESIITEAQLEEALEHQKLHGGRVGQNMVALGFIKEEMLENFFKRHPAPPGTIEETDVDVSILTDLVMKHLLFMGDFKLTDIAMRVKLPLPVVDTILETLRRDKFIEVKGGTGYASVTYNFKITETGRIRSHELFELCRYVGPAPVSLESYRSMVEVQSIKNIVIDEEKVHTAFAHLVVSESLLQRLGPAISSGQSLFVYGPPGNGKTAIAETIGGVLPDAIYIPYALTIGGQIITIFDPVNHLPVSPDSESSAVDPRWVLIKRPVIMTGGELTLKMLDLDFNVVSKFYEAPLQMKANNGLFIVDDFGRQQIEPQNLLNRWIVPLDRRIDFMALHTGMKFQIPFDMLVIFSTNLEPKALVDEAFLRRIRYKIKIDHPTADQYERIFQRICETNSITFNRDAFDFLMNDCYRKNKVELNACHPRDLIAQIIDIARYNRRPPKMSKAGIATAWENYFVEL